MASGERSEIRVPLQGQDFTYLLYFHVYILIQLVQTVRLDHLQLTTCTCLVTLVLYVCSRQAL